MSAATSRPWQGAAGANWGAGAGAAGGAECDTSCSRPLLTHHTKQLLDSAVGLDVAWEAGVYSAGSVAELPEAFQHCGLKAVPALVFQYQGVAGSAVPQLRPDQPWSGPDGKDVKYLFPTAAVATITVHERMRRRALDVAVPLIIVEGTKQYLAAVSALGDDTGYAAVGMSGCWGWSQDKQLAPSLRALPLDGRDVYLLFDADRTANVGVYEAGKALAEQLRAVRGVSRVLYVALPAAGSAGLDDVLAQVPELERIGVMRRVLAAAGGDSGKRPRAAGSRFFDERGLKVRSLADDIRHALPLAVGQDGGLYLYRDGVYVTGRDLLLAEIGSRLDEQYRPPHARAVIEFLTAQLQREGRLLDTAPTGSLLNVRNGMLDLTTEELLPHDPRYLSSVQVPVAWDPGARAPVYESWVREQAGGQVEDLEEITGTMLDRAWPPSKAMFLFGPTRSGKSTYLRLMAAVAGPQNYSAVTLAQLGTNRFAAAALHGKLLNSAADLSSHHVDDLATFKLMTGGDPVSAEHKFGQWFQFTNHAMFAFSANEVPSVGETSNAYLERMKPFSFGSSFAGREDPAVEERMLRELPGILARWVRALQTLRGRGHPLPTRPEVAAAFARGSDRVRAFLDEMTVPNEVGTPRTQLYGDFKAWAMSNGGAVLGRNKFHDRVRNAGVHEYKHRDRGMSYKVRTIDPDRPPQDAKPGPDPDPDPDEAAAGGNGGSCGSSVTTSTSPECHHGATSSRVGEEGRKTATTATVVFDLETADADRLYTYTPHDQQGYVRLFAYNDQVSHDAAPLLAALRNAPEIVGHNVLGFDLQALARHHGLNYREMATKTRDTLVLARLQDPPMSRDAHPGAKYSLDALASAHFDEGKASDLGALRDQHGGYDHIPVDDPSYRAYVQQDVRLTRRLADLYPMTAYGQREHQLLGIAGELSLQGFRVDTAALETQLREQAHRREELRRQLPLTEPLATTKGRQQLARAFAEHGVALPRSAGGFPLVNRECMDGVLARFPPDHPAARLAADVREINGQRGLLAQVSRNLVDDRVHARITAGQATGRWSVTNPGLTTLGKRGGLHVERSIFLPEDGHVIMVADLSQVDARAVAAHCQDQGFLELFGPGRDFHQEVAVAVFGDPGKRDLAKALNHSVNYGVGAAKLSEMTGVSRATAEPGSTAPILGGL